MMTSTCPYITLLSCSDRKTKLIYKGCLATVNICFGMHCTPINMNDFERFCFYAKTTDYRFNKVLLTKEHNSFKVMYNKHFATVFNLFLDRF
jgi:hypothetical protein